MTLELRITGPGLDVVCAMEEGPQLVLGRDTDCDVCLPDPERTVSRRHLSLWYESGELRFHVLSVVNGIEMPFGEAPPGARGMLPFGDTLKVGDYAVTARQMAAPPPPAAAGESEVAPAADPWAEVDREHGTAAGRADNSGATIPMTAVPQEDDPFGDWGFESTFGPSQESGGALDASKLGEATVGSFFKGLGIDPASLGTMTEGELEAMGRLVRILVLGVLELHTSAAGVKQELRAEDRTMVATKDNNPLKTSWSTDIKLRYLFGGRATAIGFPIPERSVRELLVELIAHNGASGTAARATLEGTLKEFDPAVLKTKLLGDGPKLFESTRAWDAYAKHYDKHGKDMKKWTQRLLDKYFAEAYLRESLRIRRETPPRER